MRHKGEIMARKDDRRIQRTRKLLRDSMLELILDRGYDDISIQDVTDHANLGRATFYLHYREKDDLFRDLLINMANEFLATLPKQDKKNDQVLNVKKLEMLFSYVEDRFDFYRIINMGRSAILTSAIVADLIKDNFRVFSSTEIEVYENVTGLPFDFLLSYNASTLKSTLFWWLENDMPYTAAEMADMFAKVSFYTNFQILRSGKEMDRTKLNDMSKLMRQEVQTEAQLDNKDDASKKESKKAAKKKDTNKSAEPVQEEPSPENDTPEADKQNN